MIPLHRWTWRARPVRVVDGDGFEAWVYRVPDAQQIVRVRVLDIDAPESRGTSRFAGLAARQWTVSWLHVAATSYAGEWPLLFETHQPDPRDSFGRWLADVWRFSDGHSFAADILAAGHAWPYAERHLHR